MAKRNTFGTVQKDLTRNNTINVETTNAFPDPVSGQIQLPDANPAYLWTNEVNTLGSEFLLADNTNVSFLATNGITNSWVTEIASDKTLISSDESGRLNFDKLGITSINGGEFINCTAAPGGRPTIAQSEQLIFGFDNIGSLTGISSLVENVAYVNCAAGITLDDAPIVTYSEISFANQSGNHITLTGTLSVANFNFIIATPSTGDAVFDIDPSLVITDKITIRDCPIYMSNGGTMFAAGSLDQTDPKVICFNNGNEPDSNWNGDIGFEENSTVTTVGNGNVDTYLAISGTIVTGDIERCTVSSGVYTYTGEEVIKIKITFSASIKNGTGGGRRDMRAVILKGVTELRSKGISMDAEAKDLSFSVITIVSKGDTWTSKIKNEENKDDILPQDYSLTWEKLG
jgi:hypothetical protein